MAKYVVKNKSLLSTAVSRLVGTTADAVTFGKANGAVTYSNKTLDIGLKAVTNGLPLVTTEIERFTYKYWTVDGPNTASFSITDLEDGSGFETNFICRRSDDLIGVVWDSEDKYDHRYLRYGTNTDYTGLVWDFDIEMSDTMPVLNSVELAPTLTVKYRDEEGRAGIAYIALHNYADKPEGRSAHITIDWDNVRGGYAGDALFAVDDIETIFFGAYCSEYSKTNPRVLDANVPGYLRIKNSVVSGEGRTVPMVRVISGGHNVGMSTSYDDHYNLNPSRVVGNLYDLGYRGMLNHYCGMSHYPEMHWDKEQSRFYIPDVTVDPDANVVNNATRLWHLAFARALKAADMFPVYSVSWELYSQAAREEWVQREYNDRIGRTGYEPPSYFASLCNEKPLAYLHKAYHEFANTIDEAGFDDIKMQIGEPWWWFNTDSNMPCVYDNATRIAFNEDTGLYAPDLGDIFEGLEKTDETSVAFKNWLRHKLGTTCQDIRTFLKGIYGERVQVCPLVFFPSILTITPSIATELNYPVEEYSYPNFDFIMTEAYDWVISQPPRLDLSHDAVGTIPIDTLKYPAEKVAYLSGFVPDKMIAYIYKIDYTKDYRREIWQRIFGDMANNSDRGILKQHVWAYPQVMEDSITIANDGFYFGATYYPPVRDNTPYPDSMFGENLKPYEPDPLTQPKDISVKKSSYGDMEISWGVNNPVDDMSYEVQILNATGAYAILSKRTTDTKIYLTALELADAGVTGSTVKVTVIPDPGTASEILDISVESSDAFIDTILFVGGQSHAAAHFTTMSAEDGVEAHMSANTMRKAYAEAAGISEVKVKPVLIGWGSSAADKLAVDPDSEDANNYWFDHAGDVAGPRLTEALEIMDSYANVPNRKLFWTQGSADADAYAVGGAISSTPSIYVDTTNLILRELLAKLPEGESIVWQLVNRKYAGLEPNIVEINGDARYEYRNNQIELIAGEPFYRLGTWTNGAEKPDGYINENGFRAHNTAEIYHEVAKDIGKALADNTIDLIDGDRPAWLGYGAITGIEIARVDEDAVVIWDEDESFVAYEIYYINVLDGNVAIKRTVEDATDTFTAAEQRALYEYLAGTVIVKVVGIDSNGVAGRVTSHTETFS